MYQVQELFSFSDICREYPGSNCSAQNDVRVRLQREDFFKENAAQNSYVFLGLL